MPHGPTSQKTTLVTLLLMLTTACCCWGQDTAEVRYEIETSALKNHRLKISASFPSTAFVSKERVLALPVWTPGSYKVRDYSRFVDQMKVLNSGATIKKTQKNRWLIENLPPNETLRVQYTVYGHELTVRTNYFTEELALIIGAATFLAPAPLQSRDMKSIPYVVDFKASGLSPSSALEQKTESVFIAADYDELVDSPILLGDLSLHKFLVGGKEHRLIQTGDRKYWDLNKSLKDTARLVETIQEFWGQIPYERYTFMNLITNTRGGLEHADSTVVMTSRFATEDRKAYLGWLSLLSHEFFHTWNVKRLRPKSLGPFDYENEVYTRSLWIAEGITSYYDDLLVRRAGLSTREEYLEALSLQLNRLQTTPGRLNIDLSDASFDSWIRLYQPTDDLHNSNISYYNKGSMVAWLLDTEIRKRTGGERSLDDVMRQAYARFHETGFEENEFRLLASQVADSDLSSFFSVTLDSTAELPLEEALAYWGLTWTPESADAQTYLGVETDPARPGVLKKVFANSPAARSGIAPGDELLAIDNLRLPTDDPFEVLDHLELETPYTVLFSRLGRVKTTIVTLQETPHKKSELTFGSSSQSLRMRRKSWLGPEGEEKP